MRVFTYALAQTRAAERFLRRRCYSVPPSIKHPSQSHFAKQAAVRRGGVHTHQYYEARQARPTPCDARAAWRDTRDKLRRTPRRSGTGEGGLDSCGWLHWMAWARAGKKNVLRAYMYIHMFARQRGFRLCPGTTTTTDGLGQTDGGWRTRGPACLPAWRAPCLPSMASFPCPLWQQQSTSQ